MPTESSGDSTMLEEKKAALLGRRTSSSTSTSEKGVSRHNDQSGHGSKNDDDDDNQVMVEEDTKKTQAMPPPSTSPGRGISSSEKKKHHGMDGAMLEAKKAALAGRTLQPTSTAADVRGAYQIRNDDDAGAVEEQGAINDKTDDGSPPPDAATTTNRITAGGAETTDKRKTPPPDSSDRMNSDNMLEEKKAALAGRPTQLAGRFATTAGHRVGKTVAAAPGENTKDDDSDRRRQASQSSSGAEIKKSAPGIQVQQQALPSEAKNVTTVGRTSSEDGMSEAKASIMGRSSRLREVSAASESISSSTQRQTGTENATVGDRSSSELSKNNLAVRSLNLRASRAPLGGDIEVQVQGGHEDSVQEMVIQEEGRVQPGSVAVRGIEGSARSVYFDEDLGDEKPFDSQPHDTKDQEVLLQAELVRDSVGTSERLRIVEEARQAMASEAIAAEVVEPVHDNKRRVVGCSVIVLLLVATVVAIGVVLGGKDSSSSSASPTSTDGSKEKSMAPDGSDEDAVYTGDQAFATTEELYDAVDDYVFNIALLESPETSEVALRYGYPIGAWNVSLIANFSRIFDSDRKQKETERLLLSSFNEDVSDWDVSNAETMFRCFAGASSFSGDLSSWSVTKVTDFSYMFRDVSGLNMSSISGWDTSNAEQMAGMFYGAFVTGNLSNWNTSKVKNMSQMFYESYFTEYDPLAVFYDDDDLVWCNDVDWGVGAWDVSKVEDMSGMFEACDFAADLSSWDTSKVKNMSGMFAGAWFFGDSLGSLSRTSSVVDMSFMFVLSGCDDDISGFDISGFDTSSVVDMEDMFYGTTFASSLAEWNTSQVRDMSWMFASSGYKIVDDSANNVSSFGGIAAWDVSKVENMYAMFYESSFNADISVWNTTSAVDLSEMFLEAASFSQNLCPWRSELPLEALVESMFFASGCPVPDDPVIPDGPFCFECSI